MPVRSIEDLLWEMYQREPEMVLDVLLNGNLTEPHREPARGESGYQASSGAPPTRPEATQGKSRISLQGAGGDSADDAKPRAAQNDPT